MKKTTLLSILALFLLSLAAEVVLAQDPVAAPAAQQRGRGQGRGQGKGQRRPPEVRAEARTRWLTKLLTLTPDQAEKVKQANLTAAQKHDELLAGNVTGKERNQQRRQINLDREQQINAVLTDAQKASWQQFKDEMKRRADARKAARKAGKAASKANGAGAAAPADNEDPDTESNDGEEGNQ
jgi:hypothetical protein